MDWKKDTLEGQVAVRPRRGTTLTRDIAPLDDVDRVGAGAGRITQEDLHEYHELRAEHARLAKEIEARRAGLLQCLLDDMPVEPGPYRARVCMYEARVLSASKLQEILPEDEVEELKNRVTPSPRVNLFVTFVDEDEAVDGVE